MEAGADAYLTTRELADLLRIKERKVYDLVASGEVPCVRVVGKLLFPRREIDAWLSAGLSGPAVAVTLPPIVVGSHDPLLDWALRESGSGLAAFCDGTHDGLDRFARHEAMATGAHIHESGGWNTATVSAALGTQPVVLVEFARRQRGLVLSREAAERVRGIADLAGLRVARRQGAAASQALFRALLQEEGLDPDALAGPVTPARSEDDLVRLVADGKADAAFGLEAVARPWKLAFRPVIEERFDLLVWRRAWFEPPLQALWHFASGAAFRARAEESGGYDISGLGRVHFNGAAL